MRSRFSFVLFALAGCRSVTTPPQPANAFVDSRQCKVCHAAIYQSYQNHGMARSFGVAREGMPGGRVSHAASSRRYEVRGLVQRRFEVDVQGRERNVMELAATHVVGSGNHARTYLHRAANGELTELPLTWYPQEKRWELSPGFDRATPPDFIRRIDERCLFCHNGFPRASDGALAEGIDCQRCHGPGEAHIKRTGPIVNPARLSPDRQLDVCMQCHLETTSAELPSLIVRFDRTVNSYRPGESLISYAVHFDRPSDTNRFEIAGHAYRLRQSACFLKSAGRLTCTTCHDPHAARRGADAARCQGCHPQAAANGHGNADCASCHMPKRRTEDAVHVVMTDHLIQRPRARIAPTGGSPEPAPYFPSSLTERDRDIYLGAALILGGSNRKRGIELLERHRTSGLPPKALSALGDAYIAEGQFARASKAFAEAPASRKQQYNLAQALDREGRFDEARKLLEATIKTGELTAEAECALGNLLTKMAKAGEAVDHYRRSIEARALNPEAHGAMAVALVALGRIPEATQAARRAVALDPNDARARFNLARLLQETNEIAAAFHEYRHAIRLQPRSAETHLAYGQALGDAGQLAAAIAEFRAVLAIDPKHAEARRMLALAEGMR